MTSKYITLTELSQFPQEVKDELAATLRRAQEIFRTNDVVFKVNKDSYLDVMREVGLSGVDEVFLPEEGKQKPMADLVAAAKAALDFISSMPGDMGELEDQLATAIDKAEGRA